MGAIRRLRKTQQPIEFIIVNLEWNLNGCPLFVGIPKADALTVKRRFNGIRAALVKTIKRAQIPNMTDIYEQHSEKLNALQKRT
jgi:hypothetical protein